MKMPRLILSILSVVLLAGTSAAQSSILQFGGSVLLSPDTPNTADEFTDFRGANGELNSLTVVSGSTGIFADVAAGTVFAANAPLVFDAPGPSVRSPLFALGDYSFELDVATLRFEQGNILSFVVVTGSGTLHGPGLPGLVAPASVFLTSTGVADAGRISLAGNLITPVTVPESGSALLLGLSGLLLTRRRRPFLSAA